MKPCPFCGCVEVESRVRENESGWLLFEIVCKFCDSIGPHSLDSKNEAIRLWNERSKKPQSLEALCNEGEQAA